ncbi:hypothetical protein ASPFODRAFT_86013 [Aspergillus luchuensis CBS 106.47]|uniref:Zn(2)-C6 fungal-type domain-containing protein n=1 Tax=Aspergillus luchuensis (strain CBS 106.47) TaxID=1137211 RepID=A0A1M3SZN9_ASPLC|nr:hypothetical protein ASPFODRAFT_86013 [Aspergillus luchuensis CBS 106.47]
MDNKVLIPRIAVSPVQQQRSRTRKACQPCRERKCKCSGEQPICKRCENAGLDCNYLESKRQQIERESHILANELQMSHALLREILPELSPDSARRVEAILCKDSTEVVTDPIDRYSPRSIQQTNISAREVTSDDNMERTVFDFTVEDSNRDSRSQATGFLGSHSEISWLYRLKRELEQSQHLKIAGHYPDLQYQQTFAGSITTTNYSVDETDFPIDTNVDVFGVPPQNFRSFYSQTDVVPGKRWLAILNLIFAIASRHKGLAYVDNGKECYDEFTYFSRARRLNAADFALAKHPNLQQVQVEGLTAFYLLSIGQINRSWRICGLSMRSAITMGIHLRNESPDLPLISKENRCWVWWALYTLEITLCLKTGRGPSVTTEFITAPLPLPFGDEELWKPSGPALIREYRRLSQSIDQQLAMLHRQQHGQNSEKPLPHVSERDNWQMDKDENSSPALDTSRYFLHFVQLTLIMRQSIESLYAPAGSEEPWNAREDTTISLVKRLDDWLSQLSPELHFQDIRAQSEAHTRQRVSLAFCFYSIKLLLLQPCLHRATEQPSSELCETLADSCVESAYQMLALFPHYPNMSWLYNISPWWCTLHYLMQSIVVFLMQLQHEKRKGLATTKKLAYNVEKSVRWLRGMSSRDPLSERAWEICKEIIMKYFPAYSLEANVTERMHSI